MNYALRPHPTAQWVGVLGKFGLHVCWLGDFVLEPAGKRESPGKKEQIYIRQQLENCLILEMLISCIGYLVAN